jgi:16S rRNA (cytosine967-C5)-methyltransferase
MEKRSPNRPTLKVKPKSPGARQDAPRPAAESARPAAPYERAVLQPFYKPDLKPDSLAYALLGAANAVSQVRAGTALPQALHKVHVGVAPIARGAIQDLSYRAHAPARPHPGAARHDDLARARPADAARAAVLRAGAAGQRRGRRGRHALRRFHGGRPGGRRRRAHPDLAHAKGMVNAVLRRFLREREALLAEAMRQPEAQWNFPQWWIDATSTAYPARLGSDPARRQRAAAADAAREPPPDGPSTQYLATLAQAGMAAVQVGPSAVRLAQAV